MPVAQHDDQSAQQDRDRGVLLDYQYVTLPVRLTPETKDSINEESLMRFSVREQTSVTSPMRHPILPKSATLMRLCAQRRVHETEMLEDSQRDNTDLKACACEEKSVVIMNLLAGTSTPSPSSCLT